MKKILLLAAVGVFSFSSLTLNASDLKLKNTEETVAKVVADFPVYCDGVYAGNASTIAEALAMCP